MALAEGAAAQRPHGGIVGARGGLRECCGVGGAVDKLVATNEGGRWAKTTINLGVGRCAVALAERRRRNALTAVLLGRKGGGGRVAVLVGRRQGVDGGEE
jgi:hypothetical protein